jgi:signal peptidase II
MLYLIVIILILAVDRISKLLIASNMHPGESAPLIHGVINLSYTKNTGAAFSLFAKHTQLLAVFSAVVIVLVAVFLIRQLKKNPGRKWFLVSMAFIIAGAAGNLYDRAIYGYVVDFFDLQFVSFAIFNVADCFITVGAVLFCLCILFDKKIKL